MNWDTCGFTIPILQENIKDWKSFHPKGDLRCLTYDYEIDRMKKVAYAYLILAPIVGKGIYVPQVRLVKHNFKWHIEVEGSLPRFLFQTNVFETTVEDKEQAVRKYVTFLQAHGLNVSVDAIYKATLFKLDISKILLLHPDVPLLKILEVIKKQDFDIRNEIHDKEYADFRMGGKGNAVIFGTTKKKLASLYDKIMELHHHPNKTLVEQELSLWLEENNENTYQLLRIEESLHDRQRLIRICNNLTGLQKDAYTFSDLWNKELTQQILMLRGKRLFHSADLHALLLGKNTPSEILKNLKNENLSIQPARLAQIGFWVQLANELGFKEMKRQLDIEYSRATRSRILSDIRTCLSNTKKLPLQKVFDGLYTQLQELQPIRAKEDLLLPKPHLSIQKTYSEPVWTPAVTL